MTRRHYRAHPCWDSVATLRETVLSADALIQETAAMYRRGALTEVEAITAMRQAGACEPEIAEVLA